MVYYIVMPELGIPNKLYKVCLATTWSLRFCAVTSVAALLFYIF